MTIRFMTTRAIGAAIALTISAGAAAAQTPTTSRDTTMRDSTGMRSGTMGTMQDSTRRSTSTSTSSGTTTPSRVRKDGYSATSGSTGGMQVRKETTSSTGEVMQRPAPAPVATPDPAEPAPAPTSSTMDSSMTSTSSTTTTTSTTTVENTVDVQPPAARMTRFGNGLYFGVQGGANFPQNEINSYYETGYGAGAQLGWDPANSPLGLRVNGMWNRLNGRDLQNATINNIRYQADLNNADLYSVFGDAKLRLPFGRFLGATSGLYAVGGAGVTYFRNYVDFTNTTGINPGNNVVRTFNAEDRTQFALNGGGGLSFGVGAVSLFAEGRYVRVFTQGARTDYVPVTIGITFH